ncbi:glycosyltransferase family 2 protein [Amylibacter sp.]|nr:glycosyltransferase family 2 protein [Amylibacter sp.]
MKLSIVTTLYGSEQYVEAFYEKCVKMEGILKMSSVEFILVDDGSFDNSNSIARDLVQAKKNVNLLELSRNYGHHEAMLEGLAHADGDLIFLIDSDLEEDPNWFSEMFNELIEKKLDVVYTVQRKRRKSFIGGGWLASIYYKLFRILTGINQPDNIMTCRLMTKNYLSGLLQFKEREVNIGGLFLFAGYRQSAMEFDKQNSSPTTYSISHKVNHFVNAVTSFSALPLYISFYLGALLTFLSLTYTVFLFVKSFTVGEVSSGYWSTIISIWFFSSVQLMFVGILGIYLSKIYSEVKGRPRVLVADKVGPKFNNAREQ